ncbi:MAG: hypothetical protein U0R26_09650 [Solirubrobacterales bacterium]
MSFTAIILINIAVASTLTAILAAVMLAPSRLQRHFANGHTDRQRAALKEQRRAEAEQRHRRHRTERERVWRPVQDL